MLIHPQFDPVAIHLGPLSVRWYGLMYLAGFVAFVMLGRRRIARRPDLKWTAKDIDDLLFYGVLGVVIGGRLGQVLFYEPAHYLANPLEILAVWKGGMSFHGGFLGVLIAVALYGRKVGRGFWQLTDFVAPLVPLGLGFGRIGNFIGQELWGRPSGLPWAMVFPRDPLALARHPSQLYQAALEGLLLFALLWWYSARPRPRLAVSGLFLLFYGAFRFAVEFVREPDPGLGFVAFGWLTRGQLLSLPMVLAGVAMFAWAQRRGARATDAGAV